MSIDARWAIGAGLAVVVAVLAVTSVASSALLLLFLGALVVFFVTLRVLGPSLLSPVQVVSAGFITVAAVGWVIYPSVFAAPKGGGIRLPPNAELMVPGVEMLLWGSIALCAGGMLAALLMRRPDAFAVEAAPLQVTAGFRLLLVWVAVVPTVILLATRGPANLWERATYLPEESGGGIAAIVTLGGTIMVAVAGYLLVTQRGFSRFVVLANLVAYTLLTFSTGSRRLAAIPLLVAVGVFAAKQTRAAGVGVVLTAVLAVLLVPLPLYLRGLTTHGILPYFDALPGFAESNVGIATAARTILLSVPIIGATVTMPRFPTSDLWTSVSPLGGQTAGWYDIAYTHRLNPYTPTAALGELGNAGFWYLLSYCLIAGVILGIIDRHVRGLLARGQQVFAFALVGLSGLFLVYSIQYNLRTSTRMLYYLIALDIGILVFLKLRANHLKGQEKVAAQRLKLVRHHLRAS